MQGWQFASCLSKGNINNNKAPVSHHKCTIVASDGREGANLDPTERRIRLECAHNRAGERALKSHRSASAIMTAGRVFTACTLFLASLAQVAAERQSPAFANFQKRLAFANLHPEAKLRDESSGGIPAHDMPVKTAFVGQVEEAPPAAADHIQYVYQSLRTAPKRVRWVDAEQRRHPYFRVMQAMGCVSGAGGFPHTMRFLKWIGAAMYNEAHNGPNQLDHGWAGIYASRLASLFYQVANKWEFMVVLEDDVPVPPVLFLGHTHCILGKGVYI